MTPLSDLQTHSTFYMCVCACDLYKYMCSKYGLKIIHQIKVHVDI